MRYTSYTESREYIYLFILFIVEKIYECKLLTDEGIMEFFCLLLIKKYLGGLPKIHIWLPKNDHSNYIDPRASSIVVFNKIKH